MEKMKIELEALYEEMAKPQPLPLLRQRMKRERELRAALFGERFKWAENWAEAA